MSLTGDVCEELIVNPMTAWRVGYPDFNLFPLCVHVHDSCDIIHKCVHVHDSCNIIHKCVHVHDSCDII